MDHGADADTDEDIGSNLFRGGSNLLPCVFQTVFEMQLLLGNIEGTTVADVCLHLIFKVQLLNQRSARNGNDESEHNIDDRYLPPENTHQQHKASQINHGRGDQKRECHAKG